MDMWHERSEWPGIECTQRTVDCPDGVTRILILPTLVWEWAEKLVRAGVWKELQAELDACFNRLLHYKPKDSDMTIALEHEWLSHVERFNRLYENGEPIPLRFHDLADSRQGERPMD